MTEETKPTGETPAAPAQGTEAPVENQSQNPAEEAIDPVRALATIKAQRASEEKALKELRQAQKELARYKEEETKRADAELSETEKLRKQADELKAERDKLALDLIRRDAITETGLPPVLADRLKGNTKEEMLADAKELLKVLQKQEPAQTQTPRVGVTNPGNGQTITDEDRRKFLGLRRTS